MATKTKWDTYAKCDCGHLMIAPFGKLFHVHSEVCPKCGTSKFRMVIVVARKIETFWKSEYEIKESA